MNSTTYNIKAFGELIANIPGLLGTGVSDSIVVVSVHRPEHARGAQTMTTFLDESVHAETEDRDRGDDTQRRATGRDDTSDKVADTTMKTNVNTTTSTTTSTDTACERGADTETLETGGIWRVDIGDTTCWDIIGQRMQRMGALGAIILVISEPYFGTSEAPGLRQAIDAVGGLPMGAYSILSVGTITTGAPFIQIDNAQHGTVGEVQGSWAMTQSVVRGREVFSDQHSLESYFAAGEVLIDDDIENRAFVYSQSIDSQWSRQQDPTLALDTFHRWLGIVQAIEKGADFAAEVAHDASRLMVIATVVQSGVCRDLLHIYSFHPTAGAMRQILRETARISTGWVRALALSLWSAMSIVSGPTVLTYRAACEALNTGARPSLATSLELTVGVGRAHWCCAVLLIGSLSTWNEVSAARRGNTADMSASVVEHLRQRLDGDALVAYIEQHRDDDADDSEELERFFGPASAA